MSLSTEATFRRLQYLLATHRVLTANTVRRALKHNPYWHLQPRIPAGEPEGGQWTISGPLAGAVSIVLPILRTVATWASRRFREVARRASPFLRRLPRRWDDGLTLFDEDDFDPETRRIAPSSPRRPGHPLIRFRSEQELRDYLGPAAPDREWHHIVEKRFADNGLFPPELIHSTDNVINLPIRLLREVSARMSRIERRFGNQVVRQHVGRLSFGEQYDFSLNLISEVAEKLGYDLNKL